MKTDYYVILGSGWSWKFSPEDFYKWANQQGINEEDWEFNNVDHGNGVMYFKYAVDALAFKIQFLL